jgi:hypothetical protein
MPRASQPNHDKVINIGNGLLIKKANGYWGRGGNEIDVCDNTNDLGYPYRNISLLSYDLDRVFVTTDRVLREPKISFDLWKRNKKYDGSEVTVNDFKWFNALAIVPGNYHWTNKKTRLSDKFAESFDEAPPFASTEHWKLGRIMLLRHEPEVQ